MISGISSLSHEAFDNPVENNVFIVHWSTFLTSADCSEVLRGLWNLFGENLEDNSSLLLFVLSISNLDIEECLDILCVESWQFVVVLDCFWSLLLCVNTLSEEFFHGISLSSIVLFLLGLKQLELRPELLVSGVESDSLLHISSGIVEVLHLHVGHTTEVPSLHCLWVDFDRV